MTHHAVSIVKTQQDEYVWESNDFQAPDSREIWLFTNYLLEIFPTDQTIKLL